MVAIKSFVGLGANIGEPAVQVRRAIDALGKLPRTRLVRASSLYRSAPVGYKDQPDFVNAVAEIETELGPEALLEELLEIEARFGRTRTFPNAPRILDLDLLLYGEQIVAEPGLAVPHPRMHERAFVLAPLAEIAPQAALPGRGTAAMLLAACEGQAVARVRD